MRARPALALGLAVVVLAILVLPVASQAATSPVPREDGGISALKETVLKLLPSPVKVMSGCSSNSKQAETREA